MLKITHYQLYLNKKEKEKKFKKKKPTTFICSYLK